MKHTMSSQKGVALVVALVLLVAITLLAIAGGFFSAVEEKLARSYRDGTVAMFAANSAVRRVELQKLSALALTNTTCQTLIASGPVTGDLPGACTWGTTASSYLISTQAMLDALDVNSTSSKAATFDSWMFGNITGSTTTASGVTTKKEATTETVVPPRYFVELVPSYNAVGDGAGSSLTGNQSFSAQTPEVVQYRITARGYGPKHILTYPAQKTVEATFQ